MASTTKATPIPMPACAPVAKPGVAGEEVDEGVGIGVANDKVELVNDAVVPDSGLLEGVAVEEGAEDAVVPDSGLLEGVAVEEGAEEAVEVILEISEIVEVANNCSGLGAKKVSFPGCEQSRPCS